MDAVAGYDTEAGTEFTTYLFFHVRRRFAEVSGHRGAKCRPEVYAGSLDVPLDEDTSTTRLEVLEDSAAHLAYDDIIEREANRQAYTALMGEVNKLPENQHKAIRLNVCEGLPIKDTAAVMGCIPERARQLKVTAVNAIRRTKTYRRLVPDFRPVSLSRFRCSFTSEQEEYVLWKEEQGFYDD